MSTDGRRVARAPRAGGRRGEPRRERTLCRLRRASGLLGSVAALALVSASALAESDTEPGWRERPQLTGDWGGRRTKLAAHGLSPGARYTSGFWSNLGGGFETGTTYEGFAEWWLHADLDPLLGWSGTEFEISWYSYHGGQPTENLVGAFPTQTVSGNEAAVSVRFFEILLRQSWRDGRFAVEAGQLTVDDRLFVSENSDVLLNGTFGFLGVGRDEEFAPFYPLAAPGVFFAGRSADGVWEGGVGVYTADPGRDESSNFGFGWSFGKGASFFGEIRTRRRPFGRTGSIAFGVTGTTRDSMDFNTGGTVTGSYGFFTSVDLSLLEDVPGRSHLGFFTRCYATPQRERSQVFWYLDFGFKLGRPFPSRAEDAFSLGFGYMEFSDDFVASERARGMYVSSSESVLELTYRFQATGWLTLQPDLQFFFDPHDGRRDATVIGLRAVIEL